MRPARTIGALTALAVVAGGVWYWQFGDLKAQPQTPPPRPAASVVAVEASPVRRATVSVDIDAVGTMESTESVTLAAEIAGIISEIMFDEGTPVQAGVPLVRLDDAILRAELDQARAQMTLADANYERADTLFAQRSGTQRARDEALAARQSARATLALAQTRLEKSTIKAPFAGVLGLRSVSKGEFVSPGTALISLQTIDPLRVEFRVPETFLSAVSVGQTVRVGVDALPGRGFEGKITAISPQVDVNGRALRLRASVPNPQQILRPGLFARVTVKGAARQDAILVPEGAIVPEGESRFVYRVVGGKAMRTGVKLGQRVGGGEVEVVDGLSATDVVVTAGQMRLRNGAAVDVVGTRAGS